jgi:hypothetical protein
VSLLARIFVLVGLAVLPGVIVQIWSQHTLREERMNEVRGSALRTVLLINSDINAKLEAIHTRLRTIARDGVDSDSPAGCAARLRALIQDLPQLAGLAILDASLQPTCTSAADFPPTGLFADQPWLREALATRRFMIGVYHYAALSDTPLLGLALSLANGDGRRGLVVTALRLPWLSEQLAAIDLPPHTVIAVADRNGAFLARNTEADRFVGTRFNEEGMALLQGDEVKVADTLGIDGVRRIIAGVPLGMQPLGLYVGVGLYAPSFMAPINLASLEAAAITGLGVLVAVLAAWLGARRFIVLPLRGLANAAESWRRGDLAARAPVPGGGSELSRLAVAFNAMAAALEQRSAERDRVEAELRRVNDGLAQGAAREVAAPATTEKP